MIVRRNHHKLRLLIVIFFLPILLLAQFFIISTFAQGDLSLKVRQSSPQTELPAFAADQIIVKFKTSSSKVDVDQLKADHGAVQIRQSISGRFVTLSLPENSNVTEKAEIFNRNPLVEYAHPNFFAQAHFVPNDSFYNFQWNFDDDNTNNTGGATSNPFGGANGGGIGMEQAWNISTGSSSVVVAVLDSGVAYEDFSDPNNAGCYRNNGSLGTCRPTIDTYFQAPDLANTNFSILPGSDFVNGDDHPNDDDSHGTHVTGTIAQSTNNNLGVAGVAFNTTIMPVKVLDANGTGLIGEISAAIHFATDNGADVINMSLGSDFDAQVMRDAVAYAFANGVLVVTSAGNEFQTGNATQYPAAYDASVIAVGATRYDELRAPYSSTGSYVDVAAPGGDVSVNQNEDIGCGAGGASGCGDGILQQTFSLNDPADFGYFFFQGTSMASPHVAALAALILSVDSSLSPTQLRSVIESTAEDKGPVGRDDEYGFGIIDANAALLSIIPSVAISLTTNGATPFNVVALDATVDTTATGTNDVQTIQVDTGPADLAVKSTNFTDGGNIWVLGSVNDADQVKWEFLIDATMWKTFSSADTLFTFDTNITEGATRDLFLRLTMPTSTSSNNQHSATVTIVATAP